MNRRGLPAKIVRINEIYNLKRGKSLVEQKFGFRLEGRNGGNPI
jgi:hypothetical protein